MNTSGWFTWLIIGVVTGWLVDTMWGRKFQFSLLINVFVGIIGALVGGVLFYRLGIPNTLNFNIWSLLFAFIGAGALVSAFQMISKLSRTASPL